MGEDEKFWKSLMPVITREGKSSMISPVTIATICYAASACGCAPFDSCVRRDVERNFDRYAGLFAYLKGRNPLFMLEQFLNELATRTGVFQVRYNSAVDLGFNGSFERLSIPDVNARYAVVLMKRNGINNKTSWADAVQAYCNILGNPSGFLERANSLYCAIQRKVMQ